MSAYQTKRVFEVRLKSGKTFMVTEGQVRSLALARDGVDGRSMNHSSWSSLTKMGLVSGSTRVTPTADGLAVLAAVPGSKLVPPRSRRGGKSNVK